jgi:hypothetical protein
MTVETNLVENVIAQKERHAGCHGTNSGNLHTRTSGHGIIDAVHFSHKNGRLICPYLAEDAKPGNETVQKWSNGNRQAQECK